MPACVSRPIPWKVISFNADGMWCTDKVDKDTKLDWVLALMQQCDILFSQEAHVTDKDQKYVVRWAKDRRLIYYYDNLVTAWEWVGQEGEKSLPRDRRLCAQEGR